MRDEYSTGTSVLCKCSWTIASNFSVLKRVATDSSNGNVLIDVTSCVLQQTTALNRYIGYMRRAHRSACNNAGDGDEDVDCLRKHACQPEWQSAVANCTDRFEHSLTERLADSRAVDPEILADFRAWELSAMAAVGHDRGRRLAETRR